VNTVATYWGGTSGSSITDSVSSISSSLSSLNSVSSSSYGASGTGSSEDHLVVGVGVAAAVVVVPAKFSTADFNSENNLTKSSKE
jgi:hypothetical protein